MGQKLRILWLIVCTSLKELQCGVMAKSLENGHRKQINSTKLALASIDAFECEFIHC